MPNRRRPIPWVLLLGLSVPAFAHATDCEHPVARLVAVQGEAQEQEHGSEEWRVTGPDHAFCAGDRIRTLEHSRATLELNNKTYLSLEQKTTVVFSGLKPREPSWLELVKGVIYLRSRTPSSLDVKTPFVNAAIKGTEFLVRANDGEGRISVIEGRVEASNAQGSVLLTDGQEAVAQAGAMPERKLLLDPNDAVHWALHYPPLLDAANLKRADDPNLRRAAKLYVAGRADRALKTLAELDAPIVKAALLLELGRSDEAMKLLDALSPDDPRQTESLPLRSVIALARNDKDKALELAERSTTQTPDSSAAWVALSYARQARFELEKSLAAAEKSLELAPENARAVARVAELSAALGSLSKARTLAKRAVALDPRLARAWTVRGYTELNEGDANQAERSFRQALRFDSGDPLAHFGLGLAMIRQGRLEDGTAELEIAASLDPNDALTRSYLGKAYFEQRNSKVAATELDMAKRLDPKDPTPYFYEAIQKQSENRPVEALEDMQKAIELNGNRAVYRSRQTLDSDLAARSAAQGRIYNDLGFGQRALVEGWKSVNADPTNYSAHRLLADNYANLPGHELARTSELLQSQLLQPLNVTPLQPHLAERNLALVPGSGPTLNSFNEFNPLFLSNGFRLQTSGVVGSLDTYGDEVVHSGLWNNFSYSLGQFHHETNGFRPNNRVEQDIYNAFVQGNVTPDLSVQAEYRHREITHGLLDYLFDLNPADLDRAHRRNLVNDTYRVGAHYAFSPHSHLIVSGLYRSEFESKHQSFRGFEPPVAFVRQPTRGYMVEGQYLHKGSVLDLNVGGGYHEKRIHTDSLSHALFIPPIPFPVTTYDFSTPPDTSSEGNAYVYSYIHAPRHVTWTLGGSINLYDAPNSAREFTLLNPKVGVTWDITPSTTLRAAAFRTLKRSLLTDQTIEPTQVAGFNQLYDDYNGTKAWRYGLGVDHKFSQRLFAGAEISRRDRKVLATMLDAEDPPFIPDRETLYRLYASWAPISEIAINLAYQLEVFDRHTMNFPGDPDTRTHFIPLSLGYFHPAGWLGRITTTYVNQTVRQFDVLDSTAKELHEDFFLVDAGIGYRLPGRHGILRFEVRNLFDRHFNYWGPAYRTPHEEKPLFYPERTFTAQFTLSF